MKTAVPWAPFFPRGRAGRSWVPSRIPGHVATWLGSTLSAGLDTWSAAIGTGAFTATAAGTAFSSGGKTALAMDWVTGYAGPTIPNGPHTIGVCVSTLDVTGRVLQSLLNQSYVQPARGAPGGPVLCASTTVVTDELTADADPHTVIAVKTGANGAGAWAVYFDGAAVPVNPATGGWDALCIGAGGFAAESALANVWGVTLALSAVDAATAARLHTFLRAQAP